MHATVGEKKDLDRKKSVGMWIFPERAAWFRDSTHRLMNAIIVSWQSLCERDVVWATIGKRSNRRMVASGGRCCGGWIRLRWRRWWRFRFLGWRCIGLC